MQRDLMTCLLGIRSGSPTFVLARINDPRAERQDWSVISELQAFPGKYGNHVPRVEFEHVMNFRSDTVRHLTAVRWTTARYI